MFMYDAVQADMAYEVVARTFIAEAPSVEAANEARGVFGAGDTAHGWRIVGRVLAELSPSLLRKGDWAAFASAIKTTVPNFYYELQKPPVRLEEQEALTPYTQL